MGANEVKAIEALLRTGEFKGPYLEIGTAAGGMLRHAMLSYPDETRPPFVVVDPMKYFPNQIEIVRRNLSSAGLDPNHVDFRISKSWPAFQAAERAGETYSFIFIDGSHKINHVTEDLAWTRLLEVGGIVCMHDCYAKCPGVLAAADRFLSLHPNYEVVEQVSSLRIVRKTGGGSRQEASLLERIRARILGVVYQLRAGLEKRLKRKP
jgi:predicted O-methyltransferase YrrM